MDFIALPLDFGCVNDYAELADEAPQEGDQVTWSSFEMNDKKELVYRTATGDIMAYDFKEMKITRQELKDYLAEQKQSFQEYLANNRLFFSSDISPKKFFRDFAKMCKQESKAWNKYLRKSNLKDFLIVEITREYFLEAPGTSGSALLNDKGEVIGVVVEGGPNLGEGDSRGKICSPDGRYYIFFTPVYK